MPQQGGLLKMLDTKIKLVTTTPTPAGTLKTVYAIPLLPLFASSMLVRIGLILGFCIYHGYLPVCLEIAKAIGREVSMYPPPRPDAGGPVTHPVFHIPYGCGATSYLGHIVDVIWIWINLTLLLLIKYAPARGLFTLRQKKRQTRHWISTRYGNITALGSDEEDEAWLRRTNKALMDDLVVFNRNHIYSLTNDANTFVHVPCLPEFAVDECGGRGRNGDAAGEDQEEDAENRAIEWGGDEDAHDEEQGHDEAEIDARAALALDPRAGVDDGVDADEWESMDED